MKSLCVKIANFHLNQQQKKKRKEERHKYNFYFNRKSSIIMPTKLITISNKKEYGNEQKTFDHFIIIDLLK